MYQEDGPWRAPFAFVSASGTRDCHLFSDTKVIWERTGSRSMFSFASTWSQLLFFTSKDTSGVWDFSYLAWYIWSFSILLVWFHCSILSKNTWSCHLHGHGSQFVPCGHHMVGVGPMLSAGCLFLQILHQYSCHRCKQLALTLVHEHLLPASFCNQLHHLRGFILHPWKQGDLITLMAVGMHFVFFL